MDRRSFVRWIAAALAGLAGRMPVRLVPVARAQEVSPTVALIPQPAASDFAEPLAGERLDYEIYLFRYIKAATAHIALRRGDRPGHFRGEAEANALGLVAWVTDYRRIGFYAEMEVVRDGDRPRLVTTGFTYESIRKDRSYRSIHRLDYRRRLYQYKIFLDGKFRRSRTHPIPEGQWYDDLVAAVYNFRLGAYGPVEKGRDYQVCTVPIDKVSGFTAHICTDGELTPEEREILGKFPGGHFLIRVPIDRRIFGRHAGLARFVGSEKLMPLGVNIRDVVRWGDVVAQILPTPAPGA